MACRVPASTFSISSACRSFRRHFLHRRPRIPRTGARGVRGCLLQDHRSFQSDRWGAFSNDEIQLQRDFRLVRSASAADLLPLTTSGASTDHPVTQLGASYDLTNGLIYATASKGYRIGGAITLPNICQAQLISLGSRGRRPYTSDKVLSYEGDSRSAWTRAGCC